MRVALLCQCVDAWAAGVGERQYARRFVERFARRVVHRLTKQGVIAVVVHADDVAVSARYDKAQKRRLQIRIGDVVRGHMPFDVVDGDERLVCGVAQALHAADAGEQRADKPRPVGDGEGIDILQAHVRCPERLVNHAVAGFDVRAAGDFRDDAAIERMEVNLAENDVGDDGAPILDDGGSGFVAGRFQRQNANVVFHLQGIKLRAGRFSVGHGNTPLIVDFVASRWQ